ncbi:ferredoxin [Rhodococcus sovatensis]|uniref:Ferredoxin n=1 Tax=Rhodococcus sovatensis TaxID=1805840 RepID=A0ABZ2PNR7_9NOCA
MKIELDRERCEGHGICEVAAPAFFSLDDDGDLTVLRDDVSDGDIPSVQAAALGCPVAALLLE